MSFTNVHIVLAKHTEEDLGAEHILVSWPCELLECVTHLNLALSITVNFRSVKEVCRVPSQHSSKWEVVIGLTDSVVPRSFHAVLHVVALLGTTVREPSSERENGDLETAGAKVAELHLAGKQD